MPKSPKTSSLKSSRTGQILNFVNTQVAFRPGYFVLYTVLRQALPFFGAPARLRPTKYSLIGYIFEIYNMQQ